MWMKGNMGMIVVVKFWIHFLLHANMQNLKLGGVMDSLKCTLFSPYNGTWKDFKEEYKLRMHKDNGLYDILLESLWMFSLINILTLFSNVP